MATESESTLIARRLASLRKQVHHTCPVDGIEFTGIKKAVYCSNRCRQKAKRSRQEANTNT